MEQSIESPTPTPAAPRRLPRTSQRAEAFTYEDVSFEVLTDEQSGPAGISEDCFARLEAGRKPHARAHVVCSVHVHAGLAGHEPGAPEWSGDRAVAHGRGVRASLTRLSSGIYVASCRVAPEVLDDIGPLLEVLRTAVAADDHRPSTVAI